MSSPAMTPNDFGVYSRSLDAWITNGVPESTALLVASAPELLAQLECLLAAISTCKPGDGGACATLRKEVTDARAVIAKAKVKNPPGKSSQPRAWGRTCLRVLAVAWG